MAARTRKTEEQTVDVDAQAEVATAEQVEAPPKAEKPKRVSQSQSARLARHGIVHYKTHKRPSSVAITLGADITPTESNDYCFVQDGTMIDRLYKPNGGSAGQPYVSLRTKRSRLWAEHIGLEGDSPDKNTILGTFARTGDTVTAEQPN